MDAIRVGTHCFGSREGYRTLSRSADVTDAEDAELGGFGFGQTADESFLESLEREPSAFGRPLTGGRVAITRIFQGDPDEAGRATLELRTILVAAPDMAPLAKAGLGAILQLPGLWKREAFRRGVLREIVVPPELAAPGSSERAASERLFDAWSNAVLPERLAAGASITLVPIESRPVIVAEPESLGSAAIASLAAQLPPADLARLRWGVRLVSTAGPVDLCTLAAAGRSGGRRDTQRVRLDAESGARPSGSVDKPLALARVAAERAWAGPDDDEGRGVLRPIAITLGTLLAFLLIAWITWISISAALDRDRETSGDPVLAAAPVATTDSSDRADPFSVASESAASSGGVTAPEVGTPAVPSNSEDDRAPSSDPIDDDIAPGEPDPRVVDSNPEGPSQPESPASEAPSGSEPASVDVSSRGEVSSPAVSESSDDAADPRAPMDEPSPESTPAIDPSREEFPAAGDAGTADPSGETDPEAIESPADPCEACAVLAGRLAEIAADARRAEAFGDRKALEAAAAEFADVLRSIGLADLDPEVQPRVMARVRDRPGKAVSMPADWPWWRTMICRLEALQVALFNFDDVASRLGGRGAQTRQDLMRLRKDASWILGSERAEAASLREAITRLRRNLAADCLESQPSREEQPQVEAIHAWLLLDADAAPGGGEGRFDPPGGPARPEASP